MKYAFVGAAVLACAITSTGCSHDAQSSDGTTNDAVISGRSISGVEAGTVVSALYAMGIRSTAINADSNEPGGAYRTAALSCYKDTHDCLAVGGTTGSKGAVLPSVAEALYKVVAAFNRTTRPGQIFGDEREAFEVTDLSCTASAFTTQCTVAQTAPSESPSVISRRALTLDGTVVGATRARDSQIDQFEVNVAEDGVYQFTLTSGAYLRIDISSQNLRSDYWGVDTISPSIPLVMIAFLEAGRHTVSVKKSSYRPDAQIGTYTIFAEPRP